jgi:hypothetical protein
MKQFVIDLYYRPRLHTPGRRPSRDFSVLQSALPTLESTFLLYNGQKETCFFSFHGSETSAAGQLSIYLRLMHKALRLYLLDLVPNCKKSGGSNRRVTIALLFMEYANHTPLFAPPPQNSSSSPTSARDTKPAWLYQAPRYTVTSIIPWNHQGNVQLLCLSILDTCHTLAIYRPRTNIAFCLVLFKAL